MGEGQRQQIPNWAKTATDSGVFLAQFGVAKFGVAKFGAA